MKKGESEGEDGGFAINGGRGWNQVVFNNHQIESYGVVAHAVGEYVLRTRLPAIMSAWNTPLLTRAAQMARCVSVCTIRRFRTHLQGWYE